MRVLLCGPRISGQERYEQLQRELEKVGHRASLPERELYFGIQSVLNAEALAVVDGWEDCYQSNVEVSLARDLKVPVYAVDILIPQPLFNVSTRLTIGLSGYARSGKDTVAEYLCQRHGFTRVAFADGVREVLLAINPYVRWESDAILELRTLISTQGWEAAKQDPYIRKILQRTGTEAVRTLIDHNAWITAAKNKIDKIDGPVVITDVRFPNESHFIESRNGWNVRIQREGYGPVNGHVSEVALDDWPFDIVLYNAGSLDDLFQQIEGVLEEIGEQS